MKDSGKNGRRNRRKERMKIGEEEDGRWRNGLGRDLNLSKVNNEWKEAKRER